MITLEKLDPNVPHEFVLPSKKIHEEPDVSAFLVSRAYRDLTIFLSQLNRSVLPQQVKDAATGKVTVTAFELGSANSTFSTTVQGLAQLIADLNNVIKEAPPDSGPRRFGNLAFRKWYEMVIERSLDLLRRHLPASVLQFKHGVTMEPITELQEYFLGSFGSKQRLDYGTGHELSFLAFLAGIWKLGGFANSSLGGEERAIVFGVVEPLVCHCIRMRFC
jgi:serine/threonine-protein phosphatase 2A activator